jgi:hypothetical protein
VPFLDIVGREITRGDWVAIAQNSGSSGYLSVAIVLDTFVKKDPNHLSVDVEIVRIIGGQKDWENEYKANSRSGNSFPERMVILDDNCIQSPMKEKLLEAYNKYWKL